MARVGTAGPTSPERLYLDKDGNITTDRAAGVKLVAAAGAPISPEFHDQVNQYLAAQEPEANRGAGDKRRAAPAREEAEEAEGRAEVTTLPKREEAAEPKREAAKK
jgi:hypothetical protein